MLSADASSAVAPPEPPPPSVPSPEKSSQVPPATDSWECQNCGGLWFESIQEGSNWMLEKVQYLYEVPHDRAFLSHECEACTGVYWEGGHEEINTHTGTFYKINTPWLFKGREKFWRTGPQCDYPPSDGSPIIPWGESGGDTPGSRAQSPERLPQSSVLVIFLDSPSSSRSSTIFSDE